MASPAHGFPKVQSGNTNGGTCKSGKKVFSNSAAAESFARKMQNKNPNTPLQSA